jgi:hypothetical protein
MAEPRTSDETLTGGTPALYLARREDGARPVARCCKRNTPPWHSTEEWQLKGVAMAELYCPRHSDDLIAAARRRDRARRLAIGVAGRQKAALRFRLAESRMRRRRAAHSTHLLIGPLRALRDTIRRGALRAELTLTSQAVLSATDRLLDACHATRRVPSVDKPLLESPWRDGGWSRTRGSAQRARGRGARDIGQGPGVFHRRPADLEELGHTLVRSEAARAMQGMARGLLSRVSVPSISLTGPRESSRRSPLIALVVRRMADRLAKESRT